MVFPSFVNSILRIFLIIAFFSLFSFHLTSALTINVNETSYTYNGTIITITNPLGEANNLTQEGDILNISQGNYTTQLFVNKSITILGAGMNRTFINLPLDARSQSGSTANVAAGILIRSPDSSNPSIHVNVKDLTLNGNYTTNPYIAGIFVYSANATIDSVEIANYRLGNETTLNLSTDVIQYGVLVERNYTQPMNIRVKIINSTIDNYQLIGVLAQREGTYLTLDGNFIVGNGALYNYTQEGVVFANGAYGDIVNNEIDLNYRNVSYKDGNSSNFTFSNLLIHDSSAIYIVGNGTRPFTIKNNVFQGNTRSIFLSGNSSLDITYNKFLVTILGFYNDNYNASTGTLNLTYNYWNDTSPNFNLVTLGYTPSVYYKAATMLDTDLNTYVAPAAPAPASSGGGGGGGGGGSSSTTTTTTTTTTAPTADTVAPIAWTATQELTAEQFIEGVTKSLGESERVTFSVGAEEHTVGIAKITGNVVTVRLASTPRNVDIAVGETKKFDLSDDNVYDVQVTVDSVQDGKAQIQMKSISEPVEVVAPAASSAENVAPAGTPSPITGAAVGSGVSRYLLTGMIFVLVAVAAWFGIHTFRKRRRIQDLQAVSA